MIARSDDAQLKPEFIAGLVEAGDWAGTASGVSPDETGSAADALARRGFAWGAGRKRPFMRLPARCLQRRMHAPGPHGVPGTEVQSVDRAAIAWGARVHLD